MPGDQASFILNVRVSRRHGSCYEIEKGKKKILIRVPSPGSRARMNCARHEIIEISLIPSIVLAFLSAIKQQAASGKAARSAGREEKEKERFFS